jgi:CO dehydrogenase/acetyl-CoA synthase delta subunit
MSSASSGVPLQLVLAVLVYGLERATIERAVREALTDVFHANGGEWALKVSKGAHHH